MMFKKSYVAAAALAAAVIVTPSHAQTQTPAVPSAVQQAQSLIDDAKKPANNSTDNNDEKNKAGTLDDVIQKLNKSIERAARLRPDVAAGVGPRNDASPASTPTVEKPVTPVNTDPPVPTAGSEPSSALVAQLRELVAELRAILAEQKKP